MIRNFFNRLFAVDGICYSAFSSIAATLLLWGLSKGFVWLYGITPWWVKLVLAVLFCIALYRSLRANMVEQKKRDQEQPTE